MSGQAGGPPDPQLCGGGGAAVGRQPGAAGARLLRGAQPQHGSQHLGGFTHHLHSQSLMGRVTAKLPQYAGVPHCDARVDIQLVPGVSLHGHVPPRRVPLGVQRAPAPHRLDGPGTTISVVWMTG